MMKLILILLISISSLTIAQFFPHRFPFYVPFFAEPLYPESTQQPQIPPLPPSVFAPRTPRSTTQSTQPPQITPERPQPSPEPPETAPQPPEPQTAQQPPTYSPPPPPPTYPPSTTPQAPSPGYPPAPPTTTGPPQPQAGEDIICTVSILNPIAGRGIVEGIVYIINYNSTHTLVKGSFTGFEPNTAHAFHLHLTGDMSDPYGTKTGDVFDRSGQSHGCPGVTPNHRDGDLGNIYVEEDGTAQYRYYTNRFRAGDTPGRALVVHERADNCRSPPTYGDRIAKAAVGICSDITIQQIINEFETPPSLGPTQPSEHQHGPTQPTGQPHPFGYSVPAYH